MTLKGMPTDTSLGKRLRQVRDEMGLNQDEFAKKFDKSRPTISRYERGTLVPDGEFLLALKLEYDVSIDWLLGGFPPDLKPEERCLLSLFNSLDKRGREMALASLSGVAQSLISVSGNVKKMSVIHGDVHEFIMVNKKTDE